MAEIKACMVTGHRKIILDKIEYVKQELRREIMLAVEDGYTHFISGFAEGSDLIFAEIVAELKEKYPISLEAALPYRNRINTKNTDFQRLIGKCDVVGVHSETYVPSCYMNRNRIMVQNSERVIAVYDGRNEGGTVITIAYANAMMKQVRLISI